jgi:diguanylate cyclase (GGDEF)-like protein
MIDVDFFKALNDSYGHPAGDACLRRIGEALAGAAGRRGDVLGRYGGEEFALVMPGASLQAGLVVAERLRLAVESLAVPNTGSPQGVVTVSVGVASAVAGEKPLDALLATADSALYEAKRRGRNQVVTLD